MGFELLLLDTLDFDALLEEGFAGVALADRRRVLVEGELLLVAAPVVGCGGTPSNVFTVICCPRGVGRGGG